MHPIIVKLGPLTVHSYGLMMAIAFGVGIWLGGIFGARRGIPSEKITDLSLVILISAIVGSRAFYAAQHWSEFQGDLLGVFRVWEGGLTLFGGVIVAAVAAYVVVRREKLVFGAVADAVAPSLALGLGLGRVGCFLNGCCHGGPCSEGPLCVTFPPDSAASSLFHGQPVLATQLIEAAFGFLLFGMLLLLDRRPRRDGFLISVTAVAYGLCRFGIDFLRYYEPSGRIAITGGLSITTSQVVSLGLVVIGLAGLFARDRRAIAAKVSSAPGSP